MAFFISTLLILHIKGETVGHLFSMLSAAFGKHDIIVSNIRPQTANTITDIADAIERGDRFPADVTTPIYVLLLQIFSAYFAYIFGEYLFYHSDVNNIWFSTLRQHLF